MPIAMVRGATGEVALTRDRLALPPWRFADRLPPPVPSRWRLSRASGAASPRLVAVLASTFST
jgi:hypothetical protein